MAATAPAPPAVGGSLLHFVFWKVWALGSPTEEWTWVQPTFVLLPRSLSHFCASAIGQGIWMVLQPYKVMSGEVLVIRSTGKLRYLAEDVLNYIWYILFSNIYLYSLSQAFLPTHLFTSQTAILSFPFLLLKLPLQHTYHVYDLDPCPVPVS
jgi:hypothetical protein